MMKKITTLLLVLSLTGLLLAACGKKETETTASVLEKARNAAEGAGSVMLELETTMAITTDDEESEDGGRITTQEKITADMEILRDPLSMQSNGTFEDAVNDETMESSVELYCVPADEGWHLYTHTDYLTLVEDVEEEQAQTQLFFLELPALLADAKLELQEETVKEGDHEFYVLLGTIKGETLDKVVSSLSLVTNEMKVNGEQEAAVEYRIDKETAEPAYFSTDLTGKITFADEDDTDGIESLQLSIDYEEWNPELEITVPDEVVDNAMTIEELFFGGDDIEFEDEEEGEGEDAEKEDEEPVVLISTDETYPLEARAIEDPAPVNEWSGTYTVTEDGAYFPVSFRILSVVRGEEAAAYAADSELFTDPLPEDLEYAAVSYECYVPADFPDEEFAGVQLFLISPDGEYFPEEEDEWINECMVELLESDELFVAPGETARGIGLFTIDRSITDYLLEVGDLWGGETYVKP